MPSQDFLIWGSVLESQGYVVPRCYPVRNIGFDWARYGPVICYAACRKPINLKPFTIYEEVALFDETIDSEVNVSFGIVPNLTPYYQFILKDFVLLTKKIFQEAWAAES